MPTVHDDRLGALDPFALRADFPILQAKVHGKPLVYLDNAASTQRPQQVVEAITECYQGYYANVHRGLHSLSEESTRRYVLARKSVQQFLNAANDHEVIFTSGATAAINLVARSWGDANVSSGDEVVVTEMEHHSNLVPWQQLAERTGCTLRVLPVTDDGQYDLASLDTLLNEKTRLVAVCAVSNVLGTINPVDEICRRAHQVGAVVLVDAAQSVPHLKTDVQTMDCDFLVLSGHKMCGPTGIGVLYGKEALLEAMPPFLGGGSMIDTVQTDHFTPGALPAKFEAGTPPIAQAIGLATAVDYLQEIGLEAIHQHELALTQRAHERLQAEAGVRLLGPAPEQKGGIVSLVLNDVHPTDLSQMIDLEGVAIRAGHLCAMPLHQRMGVRASARASFYLYNTMEEVDFFVEALIRVRKKLTK